jgi:arsenate reductase
MTASPDVPNVLFLCTGNSARSIIAEAILAHRSRGRARALSAGSHPRGAVHPLALDVLRRRGVPADGLRSKSWNEFAAPGAPTLSVVITVCDRAAGELCPIWPGHPATAHWSLPDPAAVEGTADERGRAFEQTFDDLDRRISGFLETFSPPPSSS